MIVRHLDTLADDRRKDGGTWLSRRLLLHRDGQPFGLHDTIIRAGTSTVIHYKHHLEAVYCVAGRGRLVETESGAEHRISDGMLYVLDGHEHHTLTADDDTDMRMICVFDPPLEGDEIHGPDGAYPPSPHAAHAAK